MKKIAYITKNLNVNGISSVVLNYCKNLDKNEFQIDIFSGKPIDEKNIDICKNNNIRIIETPPKRGKNPLAYFIFLFKNLKNYDIVHIHGNSRTIIIELLISKLNKNKYNVAHSHSVSCDKKFFHWVATPFFKRVYDLGLACSKDAGKWMFGNNKFIVIPNGIKTDKYVFDKHVRAQLRENLGIEDKFVIGHVGNFSATKNYAFLLELFESICNIRNDAVLLLIGKYNNNSQIVDKIEHSKNRDKIILYGTTSEINKFYNAMDVFVFPSKYEGLGIVLLEAQCNGLKCITSSGVPREVQIDSQIIKFLKLEQKKEEWISNILSNDVIDRKRFYLDNEEKIKQYSIETCVNNLKEIYDRLE